MQPKAAFVNVRTISYLLDKLTSGWSPGEKC